VIVAVYIAVFGAEPQDAFLWSGSIGTLILLVVYVLATVGAIRLLFFTGAGGGPRVRRWEIVVPVLGLVVLGYTLYRNVWPVQEGAGAWFPVVTAVWILLAVVYVLVRPGMSRRVGERLTSEDGLAPEDGTRAPSGGS
jgi:amino acid transporter